MLEVLPQVQIIFTPILMELQSTLSCWVLAVLLGRLQSSADLSGGNKQTSSFDPQLTIDKQPSERSRGAQRHDLCPTNKPFVNNAGD